MLPILYKLLASLFCLAFACFLFHLLRGMHKSAIVEIGFRSQAPMRRPQSRQLPFWDRALYWSLCKNVKRNSGQVWLYFGCNALTCLAWVIFPFLCVFCIFRMDLRALLLRELGYTLGSLFLILLIRFPLDLLFLPSERKRYGLDNKQKKK